MASPRFARHLKASYCIGDGDIHIAFVHINLKVMPGRNFEKLNNVGHGIMEILKEHFYQSVQKLQITVEIDELQKTYFKYVS